MSKPTTLHDALPIFTARKGYFAPDAAPPEDATTDSAPADPNAPSPRMRELLGSPLPASGLGLRVTGGPLFGDDAGPLVAVVVEIDTSDLPFAERDGLLANDIEIAFVAVDSQGRVRAANRRVGSLRVPPEQRSAVTRGLRYVVEFPAAPGQYGVRVGVHESAGDAGGSAMLDVIVPERPGADAVWIGPLFLTTEAASSMPTTGTYAVLKNLLPSAPTTARDFASGATLRVFAPVRAPRPTTPDVIAVVRNADGDEVHRSRAAEGGDATAGYGHAFEIPLTGLAAGAYALTIEAAGSGPPASRTLSFRVR